MSYVHLQGLSQTVGPLIFNNINNDGHHCQQLYGTADVLEIVHIN